MSINDKRMLDREALRSVIQQWNANRLDLFELSEPNENLEFHGVMRFYFQDTGQKVATKCIRVASDATVGDVIETLIEKFRPDMRMLSVPNYALYEVHANGEERKLSVDEKPLLVQLNWHIDDREGRFLLRNLDSKQLAEGTIEATQFKRKLSKREKKEQKKKEKLSKIQGEVTDENHVAEKLYTELPETSFTRSISNPEAVMRRRRQQKLEKKLQQFRSKDGGPDTGGTLKIYGESLCRDVPYKTLLLSIRDCAQAVVREMLAKYGMDKTDPLNYCLVQVNSDGSEYILDDDECPLSILMNHPTSRGSIMFHVRRRPSDNNQTRRRKKKPLGVANGNNNLSTEREGPAIIEVTHSGDGGKRVKLTTDPLEIGSANTNALQVFGPSIQPRHCLISLHEGVCTVTPLHADAITFVNGHHITQPTILHNGSVVMFGRGASYRFVDIPSDGRYNLALSQSQLDSAYIYERNQKVADQPQGQEQILPAVLEFPELHQESFLRRVITELDVNAPNFKLAPVYSLYLCARYRASTHYRPELQPTERAQKLTIFLHQVANAIYHLVFEQRNDPKILSFWIANASEFLHFLKSDRHISAFSVQAQEVLAESVQIAFRNLVSIFCIELSQTLSQFLSENIDHDSAAGLVLSVLGSAMALLRRCRVNAALTIQLFSQLFHYINVFCFNKFVTTSHMCTSSWGKSLTERLNILEIWAEKQGLELAADCHLAKINQCAQFLQAPKTSESEVKQLACTCFRLNSLQMAALLSQDTIPRSLIDTAILMAESVADELTRADGREVRLEESSELPLTLLLPDDGFSCEVVRGIPAGLVDFLAPLQNAGMCRLAAQPTSIGLWTVYMHQFNDRSQSVMSSKLPQPEIQVIKLHKNSNGMGLSIVAAKGAGQEKLGIYIKSVVPGGAADIDNRLQAGDQLLRVDGQSLVGITQERAADYLVRTGAVVTLEVAKQGAIYHGLATLLQQPSPITQRGGRKLNDRIDFSVNNGGKPPLPNSKSVPSLHHGHVSNSTASIKSRSINNLMGSISNTNPIDSSVKNNNFDQGFYQNLSVYRSAQQNQNHPQLGDRLPNSTQFSSNSTTNVQQQLTNRPLSAYYNTNISSTQHNNIPYNMSYQGSISSVSQPSLNQVAAQQNLQPQITRPNIKPTSNIDIKNTPGRPTQNAMMAPSMPNITHTSGYATNIHSTNSQSMQNVNTINSPNATVQAPINFQNGKYIPGYAGPPELSSRISSGGRNGQPQKHNHSNSMEHISSYSIACNTSIHQSPQKIPISSQQQLTNAIKNHMSMNNKNQKHMTEKVDTPPLPPTSTHPLYKASAQQNFNYVASNNEPPKVTLYSNQMLHQATNNKQIIPSSGSPWEREEREKEQELRREQIRFWREQQITELSNICTRNHQQEEQLKTLLLEREFEKRAIEEEVAEESDEKYTKENVQELLRLNNETRKTVELRAPSMKAIISNDNSNEIMTTASRAVQMSEINSSNIPTLMNTNVQPKSILKHNVVGGNCTSPVKTQSKTTSFTDKPLNLTEITINNTNANQMMSQFGKLGLNDDLDDLHTGNSGTIQGYESNIEVIAPPPPERNSSYVIMAHQQKLRSEQQNLINNNTGNHTQPTNSVIKNNQNNNIVIAPQTELTNYTNKIDNKRVSFHDEDNGNVAEASSTMSDPNESAIGQAEFAFVREDPNKFLEETSALLQSSTSIDTEQWNLHIQSTPGVIGAQEVYRDPRTKRLAEELNKKQSADSVVPEKLSFKEKMKMFALETGEAQTPKDKLKISRAQRDIDAVH
ncbi:afadin isoform X3 [Culicoides brevitarsis]|uniref:afadin isoform X3 n=1 Tax=Culicoides brevitarsis TaxID=469753 RepID=UPI00307B9BE5